MGIIGGGFRPQLGIKRSLGGLNLAKSCCLKSKDRQLEK